MCQKYIYIYISFQNTYLSTKKATTATKAMITTKANAKKTPKTVVEELSTMIAKGGGGGEKLSGLRAHAKWLTVVIIESDS